jgi:hypothetical protein
MVGVLVFVDSGYGLIVAETAGLFVQDMVEGGDVLVNWKEATNAAASLKVKPSHPPPPMHCLPYAPAGT